MQWVYYTPISIRDEQRLENYHNHDQFTTMEKIFLRSSGTELVAFFPVH